MSVESLECLSSDLPTGAGRLYESWTSRKKHGGIREIIKPALRLHVVTKNLHRSFNTQLPYVAPDHVHGFVADAPPSAMRASTSDKSACCGSISKTFFRRLAPRW